jgi:hypothetical protein
MMRFIVFLVMICAVNLSAKSQFKGGEGDGYSSDSKILVKTGLSFGKVTIEVYPTNLKSGDEITVSSNEFDFSLLDVNGLVYSLKLEGEKIKLPNNLTRGMYFLSAVNDKHFVQKSIFIYD